MKELSITEVYNLISNGIMSPEAFEEWTNTIYNDGYTDREYYSNIRDQLS